MSKVDDLILEDSTTDNNTYNLIPNGISDGYIFNSNYAKQLNELHISQMINNNILKWLQSKYPNTDYKNEKDIEMVPVSILDNNSNPLLKHIPEFIKLDLALLSHTFLTKLI